MLARDWYFSSFAKAYIRGPRGLSLDILQDLQFPQDPSGTVTVHQRVDDDPLLRLFPLHRLEVMWSSREGVKSVQIEELVEMGNERATTPQGIANRYIHARWNAEKQRFAHFDGAVRIYTPESYTERLKSDLKKFEGKAAIYRKLFRLDAPLDIATWSR